MMKFISALSICLTFLFCSCFPDNMKEHMAKAMQESNAMLCDMHFKAALHNIELFKLRNGYYPDSLGEINFVSDYDRSGFAFVEYTRWADRYELNLKVIPNGVEPYPLAFWVGLGCERSNMMPSPYSIRPEPDTILPIDSANIP